MYQINKTTGLILFLLLCVCSPAFCLNYYWVNGSGVWSDLSHWNTMPDGTGPIHLNIPTAMDDVYFMNNGGVGYTVTMDAANTIVKCRNMDWSSAPSGCTLTGTGTRADIHGSVLLKAGMTFNFAGDIWFVIDMNVTNTITSNGVHFPQNVNFTGNAGTWEMRDPLFVEKIITHYHGKLKTNNFNLTIRNGYFSQINGSTTQSLDLGSSEMYVIDGDIQMPFDNNNMTVGTSHIKMGSGGTIYGGGYYNPTLRLFKVTFNTDNNNRPGIIQGIGTLDSLIFKYYGTINSWTYTGSIPEFQSVYFKDNGTITNANIFNHLKFTAGKTYTFGNYTPAGQTPNPNTNQIILPGGSFTANGGVGCLGAITMITNASGTPVNIINNSGSTINTYNVLQQDIHGSGTMPLINNNGNDLGNNTGWTFSTPQPIYNLYWIGGAGEWTDPTHWSLTDGGSSSGCIPNAITNVHFTNLSGFTATSGDVEEITTPFDYNALTCRDLDFSTVTGYPTFQSVYNSTNTSILNIYGSTRFGVEMKQEFVGKIYFKGNGNHEIESNEKAFKGSLIFNGSGTWTLLDSFSLTNNLLYYATIHHEGGIIKTNGNSVRISSNWWGNLAEFGNPGDAFGPRVNKGAELWLGNPGGNSSKVYLNLSVNFYMDYEPGKFQAVKSHIIGIGIGTKRISARNLPHDFYDVTFNNNNYDCYFQGGIINKLLCKNGISEIIDNSPNNRLIHYAEFEQLGAIKGNQSFDTLVLTGGNRYIIEKNTTQTITVNGALKSMGGCDSLVYILSSDGNATATIKKETGSNLVIDNTIVENIVADLSIGVTYTINNGLTLANSSGWTVINPTPRNLYWVGNGGFWDESVHWSLSSGGPGGECPPSPIDNVVFDILSFSMPNQTVQVRNYNAFCRDMNWTGVDESPTFTTSSYSFQLHVFGNFILSPSMIYNYHGEQFFRADHAVNITTAGNKILQTIIFDNPLGDWTFTDDLLITWDGATQSINPSINQKFGTLRTNHNIRIGGSWGSSNENNKIFLGNSKVTLFGGAYSYYSVVSFNNLPQNFEAGTSEFTIEDRVNLFEGIIVCKYMLDFFDVSLYEDRSLIENVGIKNKLFFEKSGEIYTGNIQNNDTLYINEVEFKAGGIQRAGYGSLAYHKIKYAPGQTYEFSGKHIIVPKNGLEGELNIAGLPNQYIQLRHWGYNLAEIYMDDINNSPTCTQYVFLSNMHHTGSEIIQVPTPGGNVIDNSGWAFIPCNPCPNSVPELDSLASNEERCDPGIVNLVLANLLPGENAVWFSDSLLTDTIYNSANLFQPIVSTDTCFWAKIFNEGGQCYSMDSVKIFIDISEAFLETTNSVICGTPGVSSTISVVNFSLGSTFLWSNGATSSSITVTASVTTSYTVTIFEPSGCTRSFTSTITVSPLPIALVSGNTTICSGQVTTLTASGGESYLWNNGLTTASIDVSPNVTTNYTVTVTNQYGCTSTANKTVTVLILNATITGFTGICPGGSTTLTASGGGTYLWSTGATAASISISPTVTTTYTVNVTAVNGCSVTISKTVEVGDPNIAVVNVCFGQVTFTNISGHGGTWSVSGGGTINSSNGLFTATTNLSGCFSATFTAIGGCSSTKSFIKFPILGAYGGGIGCGATATLQPLPNRAGFVRQYSFDNGLTWSTSNVISTIGCHATKRRFVSASDCGDFSSGTEAPVSCSQSDPVYLILFPQLPTLNLASTCDEPVTIPPLISYPGFTAQYSFGQGSSSDWSTNNVSPSTPNCYYAQVRYILSDTCGPYESGESGCVNAKIFEIYPKKPDAPIVENTCNVPIIVPQLPFVPNFIAQYSFNNGLTWSNSNISPTTPGCYSIRTRYLLTNQCAGSFAPSVAPPIDCAMSEASFAIIFPLKPVLSNYSTCLSNINMPMVNNVNGFEIQYSINGNAYSTNPVLPTVAGCYNLSLRYVLSSACGSFVAGTTGPLPCMVSDEVEMSVLPIRTIDAPNDIVICNNSTSPEIIFISPTIIPGCLSGNSTYLWSNSNPSIGLSSSGVGNIPSFSGINDGNTAITSTIIVTPSYTYAGITCLGTPDTFTITVNPTPIVDPITNVVVCSNAAFGPINFTGNVTSTTYSWTNNNTDIGLASSGVGNIPLTFATNISGVPDTAVISVTPSFSSGGTICQGAPLTFLIIINPLPIMGNYPDIVTCAGQNIGPVIFTSNVPGAVYAWTNNNTSIGLGASGNGDIAAFVGQNNTLLSRSGRIRVYPSFTNAGVTCAPELTSFLITVDPLPAPVIIITETSGAANNDGVICAGFTATLTANGGGTYVWSTGASTASITTGTAGTYTVTVTSQGCTGTATSSIVVNPLPSPMIMVTETSGVDNNDGILCAGSSAALSASGGSTYVWSTGVSTASITTGASGTYTVTVTSQGCTATVTRSIVVNPLPAPTIMISETSGVANNDGTICSGSTAALTANGGGTYVWSTGASTASITTGASGTYTVTVTSQGCTATATRSIFVNPLPAPIIQITETSGVANNDGILCAGSTAILSASGGGTYVWSTGASTTSITTGAAGIYTVTVTSAGCTASLTRSITVNPLPDASIVITDGAGIISDNGIICSGLPATLSAGGGGMYMWSTGQTTSDINTMISGTYTVTVTSLGCWSTKSVILEFNALPCGWFECNIGSGCDGAWTYNIPSDEYTGTSTNCYYANPFNHDELSFTARNLCGNGSITVEVKSITGNLAWAGISMRETNADDSKKIQLMTNLSLLSRREARYTTGGTSYFQQFPSQNRYWLRLVRTGNQFAGYVSPDGSYWYPVMAADINMNACLKVGMVVTNYNPISTSTAVFGNVVVTDGGNNRPVATDDLVVEKEVMGWKDLTVKPNPTTGQIELDMTSFKNIVKQLEIYNSQGKLVKTEWVDQQCDYLNLDLSAYHNGVYLLRMRTEGQPDISKRIVLLK